MKRRLFTLFMTVIMMLTVFTACTKKTEAPSGQVNEQTPTEEQAENNESEQPTGGRQPIRIGLLKGPTAIGAVMLMNEAENGKVFGNYEFEIFTTPDEVTAKIINGELDVAAVPVNLASVLYNKTEGKILTAAVNTLGTLYLVENGNEIQSVADLSGKTVVMAGQGAVPEYVFKFILDKAGITDCTIEFVQSHAEAAAAVASGTNKLAILPEPFVSVATVKSSDIRVAIDIAKEWDTYSYQEEGVANTLTMGCLAVRKEFVENYEKEFNKFLDEYEYFIEVANDDPATTAEYVVNYGIIEKQDVAEKAIPNCNIVFIEGSKMLRLVQNFLNIMYEANPKSIGGAVPDDAFYYVRKY